MRLILFLVFLGVALAKTTCSVGERGQQHCTETKLTAEEKVLPLFADYFKTSVEDAEEQVYRGMTRDEVWDEYNVGLNTQEDEMFELDVDRLFEGPNKVEQAVKTGDLQSIGAKEVFLDVPYGDRDIQKLDVYIADAENPPVHVFIHGGYWTMSEVNQKSLHSANVFLPYGVSYVSIGYGLTPDDSIETQINDCREAVAWVWKNAEKFGWNRDRIHTSGMSAGGHLVAEVLATSWPDFESGLPVDLVKSAVAVTGVIALEPLVYLPWIRHLGFDKQRADLVSPHYRKPTTTAPLIAVCGERESREWIRNHEEIVSQWRAYGVEAELMLLKGLSHFEVDIAMCDPTSTLSKKSLELIFTDSLRKVEGTDGKLHFPDDMLTDPY